MPTVNERNVDIVAEFRANGGKVGGQFEGAPIVLLHHAGRNSGEEYVAPTMYLADDNDPDRIYVFASKGGAPSNPDWYHNLIEAGAASVEVGTDSYRVTVKEITGAERDELFAEQAKRYPGFADYEQKTAGIRTIPVLALQRLVE
jgi:deazaflavin-dependent oxidoreductase (nitroreductase family)